MKVEGRMEVGGRVAQNRMNKELISPFVLLAHPDILSHRLTLENHSVSICVFNPDGLLLAAATYDGLVLLVDTITSQIIRKLHAHVSSLNSIDFSDDVYLSTSNRRQGQYLLTAGSDYSVVVWENLLTPRKYQFNAPLSCARFSVNNWIAVCPLYQSPVLIDPEGRIVEIVDLPANGDSDKKSIHYACWAKKSNVLFLTGSRGQVHIIRDGRYVKTTSPSSSSIKSIQISADENYLLLNCADRIIRLVKIVNSESLIDLQMMGTIVAADIHSQVYGFY